MCLALLGYMVYSFVGDVRERRCLVRRGEEVRDDIVKRFSGPSSRLVETRFHRCEPSPGGVRESILCVLSLHFWTGQVEFVQVEKLGACR